MSKFKDFILNLLFPQKLKCIVCHNEMLDGGTASICEKCYKRLPFIKNPCLKCGDDMSNPNNYCLLCKNVERNFDRNVSVFVYENEIKNLIYDLKRNNARYLTEHFAPFMAVLYTENKFNCDFITAIPASPSRFKSRGFNQAELLARDIAKIIDLNYFETMTRIKDSHQIDKSFKERQENLKNGFKIIDKEIVFGKNILLIDDVCTTGASLSACAKILKMYGATHVYCLTFAHTPKRIEWEKEKKLNEEQKAHYSKLETHNNTILNNNQVEESTTDSNFINSNKQKSDDCNASDKLMQESCTENATKKELFPNEQIK